MSEKAQRAKALFLEGYNCAQAVAGAFAPEMGLSVDAAARLASGFGGGMGRMREVCGAVSGMTLAASALRGYNDPKAGPEKTDTYAMIQELAGRFPIAANGCVALTVELRGQGDVAYAQAQSDADAIIAYLARQGHVARPAPPLPELEHPATPLAAVEPIKATTSGIVVFRRNVGDDLEPGDAVADIVDPLRATVTPLVSEHGGRLFARQLQRFATTGETIAKVAGRTAFRSGELLGA